MSMPAALSHADATDQGDRLIGFARRLAARIIDTIVIVAPIAAIALFGGLTTVLSGAGVGASVGGFEGAFAGFGVTLLLSALVGLVVSISTVAVPLFYFRWAARRPHAQTLGRQALGLEVVRTADGDGRRIRGRTLLAREVALFVVCLPLLPVSGVAFGLTDSTLVSNVAVFAVVALVLWRAADRRLPHDRLSSTAVREL